MTDDQAFSLWSAVYTTVYAEWLAVRKADDHTILRRIAAREATLAVATARENWANIATPKEAS